MNTSKILISAFCAMALVACAKTEQELLLPDGASPSTKVVKFNDNVLTGSFLVKFEKPLDAQELESFKVNGVESIGPLFVSTKGNEELEAQFGLDRWYEFTMEEGASLDAAVLELAHSSQVNMVEYNHIMSKNTDGKVYPAGASTKATAEGTFNDPYLGRQWHYRNGGGTSVSPTAYEGADVNVVDVWKQLTCGDRDIIVAVVDEGVCFDHPDLKANMWVNSKELPGNGIDDDGNGYIDDIYGYNFVDRGTVSWSGAGDSGHGTHCAGTIAAVNNNGVGVCGVAGGSGNNDGCRIMSCQIFSDNKGGSSSISANAIKYAADNGASIISCSFGYNSSIPSDDAYRRIGSAEIDAVHYFEAHKGNNTVLTDGNIAIFAAGNDAQDFAHYPGAFYDIISVSAFGPDFLPTHYTNYGPGCNIAAPGGEAYHKINGWSSMVLSTTPSNTSQVFEDGVGNGTGHYYGYMQGTSMACPHVSGVVALALSYAKQIGKKFTVSEFKNLILSSVNDIDQRIASVPEKKFAYSKGPLAMAPFYHKVGTGAIDAWRLMMQIEGIPTVTTQVGRSQWVDISNYFGSASVSLTYLSIEVPQSTVDALGLQKLSPSAATGTNGTPLVSADGYAYEQFGRLYIHPTKVGSGTITIKAVGGGDKLGGGSNPPGGMEVSHQVSVISRNIKSTTGGWL